MTRRLFWIVIAVLAAVRLALMATMPVFEPSEARYSAIAANMARTGDFTVPRFTHDLQYQPFDGKPPLVFQAGGWFCRALGVGEGRLGSPMALQLGVRLFPLLSAALALWALYLTVRRKADEDAARLATVICATCFAFYAAAGIMMTDMTLTASVASALLVYGLADRLSWKRMLAVVVLLAVGFLAKGPVAIVLFGLPVAADALVNRNWRKLFDWRWLALSPVFLAIVAPWFVLMEREVPGSTWYFFYHENFLRFVRHDYGDKFGAGREAFRGVSVLWAAVVTLPWLLLPLWKWLRGRRFFAFVRQWREFPMLALLSIVGFWSLTSRVLVYYLFPVVPLFAAFLAMKGDRLQLARFVKPALAVAAVGLVSVLLGGMAFSDKMRGAETEFQIFGSNYANEFYHGTKSAPELSRLREERDLLIRKAMERTKRQ